MKWLPSPIITGETLFSYVGCDSSLGEIYAPFVRHAEAGSDESSQRAAAAALGRRRPLLVDDERPLASLAGFAQEVPHPRGSHRRYREARRTMAPVAETGQIGQSVEPAGAGVRPSWSATLSRHADA